MNRFGFLLLCFFITSGLLSSCSKDDVKPDVTTSVLMAQMAQKWRLDEIYQNNQLASSGSDIKDRYTIQFKADGTYVQTQLTDGTTYNGTWKLDESKMTLTLVDHKGSTQEYAVGKVSDQELRYAWINKSGATEERRFTSVL